MSILNKIHTDTQEAWAPILEVSLSIALLKSLPLSLNLHIILPI